MKTRFIESGIGFSSENSVSATSYSPNINTDTISDIVRKESGGNYRATNPNSSAVGKYQFLWNTWGDKIKQFTGVRDKKDFLNNPNAQDRFFHDYYLPNEILPAIKRVRKATNTSADDGALTKLIHFRGEGGAKAYLSGKLSDTPEGNGNMAISKYTGIPKMSLGGVISTASSVIQPLAQMVEGDDPTNINRAMLAGAMQSGVVGAAMKGYQAYQANKLKQENKVKQGGLDRQMIENNSMSSYNQLALNPVGYYAKGGAVSNTYEAEKGEVALGDANLESSKELAPGIQEVGGKSHEEGGTKGQGGDFIFSNRININSTDVQAIKTLGINVDENLPYSDAVKKLAVVAKKYAKPSSNYRLSNTNKAMLGRVNTIMQILANNQEQNKQ